MKVVLVKGLNGANPMVCSVRDDYYLSFGDKVLLNTTYGNIPVVCMSDSFNVPEELIDTLCDMHRTTREQIRPIVGNVYFRMWEEDA